MSINQSGKNPKPVILHSIRVGLNLYNLGCPRDIVVAALLHDILEDTDTSPDDIKKKFGEKIARLIQSCSFNDKIADKTERYKEATTRCLAAGKEALIIKAADFINNIPYTLDKSVDDKMREFLRDKAWFFIEKARPIIANEKIFTELKRCFNETFNN